MVMPKGQVFDHGYATAAMGYREISEFMVELGDKMNHSTARNVFMSAMTKLSNAVINIVEEDSEFAKLDPELAAKDPRFQSAIESYLREMCTNKES